MRSLMRKATSLGHGELRVEIHPGTWPGVRIAPSASPGRQTVDEPITLLTVTRAALLLAIHQCPNARQEKGKDPLRPLRKAGRPPHSCNNGGRSRGFKRRQLASRPMHRPWRITVACSILPSTKNRLSAENRDESPIRATAPRPSSARSCRRLTTTAAHGSAHAMLGGFEHGLHRGTVVT